MSRTVLRGIEWAVKFIAVASLFVAVRPHAVMAADGVQAPEFQQTGEDVVAGATVEVDVDSESDPPIRPE